MPNLRGLFLLDHGGNSAELGTIQANLIKDHVHISYYTDRASDGSGYFTTGGVLEYAPARTDPVEGGGIENRPVNQAVRHLIRARLEIFCMQKKRSMFTVETGHEAAVAGPEKHFAAFSDPAP